MHSLKSCSEGERTPHVVKLKIVKKLLDLAVVPGAFLLTLL